LCGFAERSSTPQHQQSKGETQFKQMPDGRALEAPGREILTWF